MPSLDCPESSGMSTTLTQSALDDAIAGSAIALGEGEVVALATFTFFEGSTIGSVCQLDLFGLRLSDRFHENYYRKQRRDGINNLFNATENGVSTVFILNLLSNYERNWNS